MLDIAFGEGAVLAQAGILNQNVHNQSGSRSRRKNLLGRGRFVQVRNHNAHFSSLGYQLGGQRFKPVPAARRENQFRAVTRQFPRQRHANTCACAGHQRPFAVELLCVCHRPTIITNQALHRGTRPESNRKVHRKMAASSESPWR